MDVRINISQTADIALQSQKIRYEVFVKEQGIPVELDLDGQDKSSYHFIAYVDSIPVGTARLSMLKNDTAVLARVAIIKKYRGLGISRKLVNSLITHAKALSLKKIEIHAHYYLKEFYKTFGFIYIKDVEKLGEHQLVEMQLITE